MLRQHDTAVLVTPIASWLPDFLDADWIGIDAGYKTILEHGHSCLLALGDFDSGSLEEKDRHLFESIELPEAKNETDSEAAMAIAAGMGYSSIFLVGGLGGRIDHTIANLRCIGWHFPQVTLLEKEQRVFTLLPGVYSFFNTYRHISFFALEPSVISLEGFDYPLERRHIDQKDLYTCSNSIAQKEGTVKIEAGRVLCVESNVR